VNIHFRKNGINGDIFAVMFDITDKELYAISGISIGKEYWVVKPLVEGEWKGLRILKTGEPFVPAVGEFVCQPYIPNSFPTTVSKHIYLFFVYSKLNAHYLLNYIHII